MTVAWFACPAPLEPRFYDRAVAEFVPSDFDVPRRLETPQFVLEPLDPEHNDQDYDAWTSSREHIRATPGWEASSWPREMTPDENRADLQRHADDFRNRRGFTYTVLDPARREVIGWWSRWTSPCRRRRGVSRARPPARRAHLARVADVLAFAQMHLSGGLAADGTRVLSSASAEAMTAKEAELPDSRTLGDSWVSAAVRYGWGGERLIGHDGTTLGQAAFLRVLPSHGLAVALLTNGGYTLDLSHASSWGTSSTSSPVSRCRASSSRQPRQRTSIPPRTSAATSGPH